MQLTTLLTAALLPLVALAQDSTTTATSTVYLTKTIKIAKVVATTTMTYNNATSSYMPTGTGASSIILASTTTPSEAGSTTSTGAVVSPSIDNNSGSSLGAAQVAIAGVAGIVVAALM
ncbi:hypothetical protein NKR23_g2085 [Pleurostoma richardsiae]|jgi:hypothetical protein|uniref:Antifreeze protein n=1 Tax=Pleurostoma richardsiae TaxID=41990 RepID=A0AA38S9G7_9PEZI|nr:hypothetical protein NKR23_g2085 [Pleurostoma richardsiae]